MICPVQQYSEHQYAKCCWGNQGLLAWLNSRRQTRVCGLGYECNLTVSWCQLSCWESERPAAKNGWTPGLDEQNKTKQVVEITKHTMGALPLCSLHTFCTADSPVPPWHPGSLSSAGFLFSCLSVQGIMPALVKTGAGTFAVKIQWSMSEFPTKTRGKHWCSVCDWVWKPSASTRKRSYGFIGFYLQGPNSYQVMPKASFYLTCSDSVSDCQAFILTVK